MSKNRLNYKKELDKSDLSDLLKGFLRNNQLDESRYDQIAEQVTVSENSLWPNGWVAYYTIVVNVVVIEVARHLGISQSKAYDEFVRYSYLLKCN